MDTEINFNYTHLFLRTKDHFIIWPCIKLLQLILWSTKNFKLKVTLMKAITTEERQFKQYKTGNLSPTYLKFNSIVHLYIKTHKYVVTSLHTISLELSCNYSAVQLFSCRAWFLTIQFLWECYFLYCKKATFQ